MTRALIFAALLLAGCAAPTPFVTGEEVPPPPGCIDYRARGGQC
ncbi:hypothetical protein [Stutzerimonas xanthomarina]